METIKKTRKTLRATFTKSHTAFTAKCNDAASSKEDILVAFQLLESKMAELDAIHASYNKALFESDTVAEADLMKDIESDGEYKAKYFQAKLTFESLVAPSSIGMQSPAGGQSHPPTVKEKTLMKYPKRELPSFEGSVKEWFPFWSVFKKVHNNKNIQKDDKLQLLRQCVVDKSRAHELVYSYPPTSENYDKVITSLQNRFGREDLVIEYYVRELLSLVLQNAMKGVNKLPLKTIYDKVDSYIRALDSLGINTGHCAAMLCPLVESALPADILKEWQRAAHHKNVESSDQENADQRLSRLLEFMRREVEGQEKLTMALTRFGLHEEEDKTFNTTAGKTKKSKVKSADEKSVPATASTLIAAKDSSKIKMYCIFCKENKHYSSDCDQARKLSYNERRMIAQSNNRCFKCFRRKHFPAKCNVNVKCSWCGYRHVLIMCKMIDNNKASFEKANDNCSANKNLEETCY